MPFVTMKRKCLPICCASFIFLPFESFESIVLCWLIEKTVSFSNIESLSMSVSQ